MMWWSSSKPTEPSEPVGTADSPGDLLQEIDDDEFDRLSQTSWTSQDDEFFLVSKAGDLKQMQVAISAMEVELKEAKAQLAAARELHAKEIALKDRSLVQKEKHAAAAEKDAQQRQRKLEADARALEARLTVATKAAQDAASEARRLLDDAAALRRRAQEAEAAGEAAEATATLLREELRIKSEEAVALRQAQGELQSALAEQERLARSLQAALTAQGQAAGSDLPPVHREVAQVRQRAADLEEANAALGVELRGARAGLAAAKADAATLALRVSELESQKAKSTALRDDLKKELERCQGVAAQLAKELAGSQAAERAQGQEVARLTQAGAEQAAEAKRLAGEVQRRVDELESQGLKIKAAESEAARLKAQLLETTQELTSTRYDRDEQKARVERMQKGVEEVTRKVDTSIMTYAEVARIQNKHKPEVARIMRDSPNCVPIRCVRADNCDPDYPTLEKKKFAAPKDMTLSRFNEHIRQKMKLAPEAPFSIYVDSAVPIPSSELLEDIYRMCRGVDDFLHLKYSSVSEQAP